ncbi:MAG: endonuclease III domain-containing protein [Deltaproteobacteria bacterium]|nr:endonuclease III domain-containing protein [Deltaproteobacteria bacterium]
MQKKLLEIFDCLLAHFGPRDWWPAETPFEVIIGAILTQNTAWTNVEKAIKNLVKAQALTPAALAALPVEILEKLIQPSGYFRQKAERLQLFASFLLKRYGGDLDRLFDGPLEDIRTELLARKGIGPETADSILLYAGHLPSFVVDAYTLRIFSRLGLLSGKGKYAQVRSFFMAHLPQDAQLFNEYHALIVEHGKSFCKKNKPLCPACPLKHKCPYAHQTQPSNPA